MMNDKWIKYMGYGMVAMSVLVSLPALLFKPMSWGAFWFIYNGTTIFLMGFLFLLAFKLVRLEKKVEQSFQVLEHIDQGILVNLLAGLLDVKGLKVVNDELKKNLKVKK